MKAAGRQVGKTVVYLELCVAAVRGICAQSRQHADDTAAFLAPAAGMNAVVSLMGGMAGHLVSLQQGVAFQEGLFNKKLGQRPQQRKLADRPPFLQEISGKGVVKGDALIIEPVVVMDSLKCTPLRGIVFVAYDETADTPLAQQGKGPEQEHRDGPKADGIFIGSNVCKVLSDKGHMPQHPGEDAIAVDPHSGGVGDVSCEIPVGVQCRKPVSAGLVYEDRVGLSPRAGNFVDQAVAQEAVFAAA